MSDRNAYMAKYMLERYHRRRLQAIGAMGGRCAKCGSVDSLEFDHIDRAFKRGEIAKWLTQGEQKYLKELERCQLLCKPCHREKTNNEISVGHGGGLTGKRNCYCDLCRPLKLEYMRNRRELRASGAIGSVKDF